MLIWKRNLVQETFSIFFQDSSGKHQQYYNIETSYMKGILENSFLENFERFHSRLISNLP